MIKCFKQMNQTVFTTCWRCLRLHNRHPPLRVTHSTALLTAGVAQTK